MSIISNFTASNLCSSIGIVLVHYTIRLCLLSVDNSFVTENLPLSPTYILVQYTVYCGAMVIHVIISHMLSSSKRKRWGKIVV